MTEVQKITEKFDQLYRLVKKRNRLGFYDLARFCEEICAESFRIIFGWNLENLNHTCVNYPVIDLADHEQKIAVQVTSNETIRKVNQTIKEFYDKGMFESYEMLVIFVIGKKGKDDRSDVNKKFPFKCTILDLTDLMSHVRQISKEKQTELLDVLYQIEDAGLLQEQDLTNLRDNELMREKTIITTGRQRYYAYGLGRVRIDAFLPVRWDDELCCLILFRSREISGSQITLSQSQVIEFLFPMHETGLSDKRPLIKYIHEGMVALQLPNCRITVDIHTAKQLCMLIDDLYETYEKQMNCILEHMGAMAFDRCPTGQVELVEVTEPMWEAMERFARMHSCDGEDDQWDMFLPQFGDFQGIVLYHNHKNARLGDVLCILSAEKKEYENTAVIRWSPGYTTLKSDDEGFDNECKWKADYTHDWMMKKWIPYLCYQDYLAEKKCSLTRRIFERNLSFTRFMDTIYPKCYVCLVRSLKNKQQ